MGSVLHLLGPDLSSGTAKQIRYLTDGLKAESDHVVCSLESNQAKIDRLDFLLPGVVFCRQSLPLDPTLVVRLARRMRDAAPDILHCWGTRHPWHVFLAQRLARVKNCLWSVRSTAEQLRLASLPRGQSFVTNGPHLAAAIDQTRHGVTTLPNGLPVMQLPEVLTSLHRELDVSAESKFIAAVGDLRTNKRWQDVVWALDLLRVIHPNVHLLVIGAGDTQASLQSFISQTASASFVHCLGFRNDVSQILRQCVCFWQGSDDEGCSNAILEALAVGVPIVATDIPGHQELLGGGTYGSLVCVGDCAEMARKTNMILSSSGDGSSQIQESRKQVLERFALDQMLRNYRELYRGNRQQRSIAA